MKQALTAERCRWGDRSYSNGGRKKMCRKASRLASPWGWLKFPYVKQGVFSSGPVALEVHAGDWHEGSDLYRKWYDQHFHVRRLLTWLRKKMA